MTFNITDLRNNLAIASTQLAVFRANFKDNCNHAQADILNDIIDTVVNAEAFFNRMEDDDFDDDDDCE